LEFHPKMTNWTFNNSPSFTQLFIDTIIILWIFSGYISFIMRILKLKKRTNFCWLCFCFHKSARIEAQLVLIGMPTTFWKLRSHNTYIVN
jgi:hypothetical protein